MASGIPSRAGNLKLKAKRAASWTRNQVAKQARKEKQAKQEAHNIKVGSTGKQRANQAAKELKQKLAGALENSATENVTDLGDFTEYVEE